MANPEPFVSETTFTQILTLLQENRQDIRGRIADLSQQLSTLGTEIKTRQDLTNGRVREAEGDIKDLQAGLSTIETDVATIKDKGCPLREQHGQALAALTAAGIVPGDAPASPWRRAKTVGKVGGWMGGGAILVELLKVVQAWFVHLR